MRVNKSKGDMVIWNKKIFCNAKKEFEVLSTKLQGWLNNDQNLIP